MRDLRGRGPLWVFAGQLSMALFLLACSGTWTGGIHARMGYSRDGLRVVDVPEGPAATAGLEPGDRIVAIDGEAVAGLDLESVVERLRGPVGSRVVLSVERDGRRRQVEVTRAPYE